MFDKMPLDAVPLVMLLYLGLGISTLTISNKMKGIIAYCFDGLNPFKSTVNQKKY